MPLLTNVEKRSAGGRLLLGLAYLILIIGSIATVYPFLLMLSSSVASSADADELRVVPRYLVDDSVLFDKYVDEKYEGDLDGIAARYHTDIETILKLPIPAASAADADLVRRWVAFARTLPLSWRQPGFRGYSSHYAPLRLAYQAEMRRRFHGDIAAYDAAYTEQAGNFLAITPPAERPDGRLWIADESAKMRDFITWKATLPEHWMVVCGAEPAWTRFLREDVYNGDAKAAAKVWGPFERLDGVPLSFAAPTAPDRRRDWEAFVRRHLTLRYVGIAPEARARVAAAYAAFLKNKYRTVARLNASYDAGAHFASFAAVPLPDMQTARGVIRLDWADFVAGPAPLAALRADTPENRFRAALVSSGAMTAAEAATVQPPYASADAMYVRSHATTLRADYLLRNYGLVLDYILLHGRALWVTIVFCLAAVVTALIVNPLCAYALSRFDLPSAYQILLFLLATMAFPAEVTMIPSFLMLKEMNLLNTFWALVLPGAANGYAIFLLKGFFDSLPRDLYEAGMLDGAGELRMMREIALPMSSSILAVIALQAFTCAYGAFMFALVVCQDSRMWTVMVWLYQLQASSPKYIVMAALTVAAIPTLLVFLFAQKVILRGVLVPIEK